jgi:hypothetical protein
MPSGKSLDEVITDAQRIIRVWEANPTFSLGEIKLADLKALLADFIDLRAQTEEARATVTRLVNASNDKALALSGIYTRALSGIRAVFGPDSSEYDEAGGTRSSQRKAIKRKAKS